MSIYFDIVQDGRKCGEVSIRRISPSSENRWAYRVDAGGTRVQGNFPLISEDPIRIAAAALAEATSAD